MTIGDFSAVTHLSIRTLRRYHEAGLIHPAVVDDQTGYRYYTATQIPIAQVIHRLRELDVPLAEVKAIITTGDPDQREALIAAHLRRLEHELDRTRTAVTSLRQLLRPDVEHFDVQLRSTPARVVAAIRSRVEREHVLEWYERAMATLDAAYPVDQRVGPPGGRYDNELFIDGIGELIVYHPVRQARAVGSIERLELGPVELAVTTHTGAHDDIDITYGRLATWVLDHTLVIDGPIHETYLVGPRDTPDPSRWRTEIGWPIFRVSGSHASSSH